MKPIIGILADVDGELCSRARNTYVRAIACAGGLPFCVPYSDCTDILAAYAAACDGFFFTGGVDIEPWRYGDTVMHSSVEVAPRRDELEFSILERVLTLGKPVLGVCRGAQLINVALGGTLYQDIDSEMPSDIRHRQAEPRDLPSHGVKVVDGTPLSHLIPVREMAANSFHHQAIKRLGRGLSVMACAPDGVIEAIYRKEGGYIRAYQWHPELLFASDAYNRALFLDFIDACKKQQDF